LGYGAILQVEASRASWRRFACVIVAPTLLALSGAAAFAQNAPGFIGALDPLFQGVLTRPANLDNTLQYAAGAAQAGDIEPAISAYEQLLFYNPTLSETRFELAILYYRLGSYDMARGYLQSALEMHDVTPDLRQKIDQLLELADKKLMPDQFTGFVQTGVRYQSNASQGPGPQTTLASGQNSNGAFLAKPDWNWFGTFGLDYVHDFEDQTGTTFEASMLGYDAQQFMLHQFDIGLLEIRAGPRFSLSPGNVNGVTIKPYLVATGGLLADTPYFGGLGGGLTLHANAGNVSLDPYAEIVQQSFINSTFYPLASGLSGTLSTYGLQAAGPIGAGLSWQSRLAYAHASDQFAFDSFDSYAADIWLPWNFSVAGGSKPWTLVPTGGVTQWRYGAADPSVNAAVTARTTEWRVGLGLEIPIWAKFTLASLVQYRDDVSNVPAFSMRDLAITAGPTFRF
jgi:hypothetical protein